MECVRSNKCKLNPSSQWRSEDFQECIHRKRVSQNDRAAQPYGPITSCSPIYTSLRVGFVDPSGTYSFVNVHKINLVVVTLAVLVMVQLYPVPLSSNNSEMTIREPPLVTSYSHSNSTATPNQSHCHVWTTPHGLTHGRNQLLCSNVRTAQ